MTAGATRATSRSRWIGLGPVLAVLLIGGGCGRAKGSGTALPVTPGTVDPANDPLGQAITRYRETGQTAAVEAYIAAHPDEERSAVWHELLALAAYDSAWALGQPEGPDDEFDPVPVVSARGLKSVVVQYPGTFAAQMAHAGLDTEASVLESAALRTLGLPAVNERVVAFLSGDDGWAAQVDGGEEDGVQIDLRHFRRRHSETLKSALGAALQADACKGTMGYCRWFVARFPDDPHAGALETAMAAVWYRRAHPPWKSKAHLQCAYDCANRSRAAPPSLDDTAYAACFARC